MIFDRVTRIFRKKQMPQVTAPVEPVSGPSVADAPVSTHAERLNRWLTLGANIGVLLGLLVLIVEVRQNAALSRASMEQNKNDRLAEIELNYTKPEVSAVWIKSVREPENLTDKEIRMLDGILAAVMLQWEYRFLMWNAGLTDREGARQQILNSAPYHFGSRFAKHWWRLQADGWEGTVMMEVAGPIIDDVDENFLADYYDSLKLPPPVAEPDVEGGE
jgi:hypothetical protein